jgi:curved DNA-binding protein CbpA
MNHYLLLGVPQDADPDMIRSAFRALARRYHPDAGEGSSADRFRQILNAYETLNDPTRRGDYDRSLQNRSVTMAQLADPLRARAVPEPMLSRRRGVVPANSSYAPLRPMCVTELIAEWFQFWDDVVFGDLRRRDRI